MDEKRYISVPTDVSQGFIVHDTENKQYVVFVALRSLVPVFKVPHRHRITTIYQQDEKLFRLSRFDDKREPDKWAMVNGFGTMLLHSQVADKDGVVFRMVNQRIRQADNDMLAMAPEGPPEVRWGWVHSQLNADQANIDRLVMAFNRKIGRV